MMLGARDGTMYRQTLSFIIVAIMLGGGAVSADEYETARSMFHHPPSDEEYRDWALELAGDDPARRAAMLRWLSIGTGFNVVIDQNWDRLANIHVEDFELKAEHLDDMHLFPEMDLFTFERAKFSDGALKSLAKQKHITSILSDDARFVDNRFCQAISELPKLEGLGLTNTQIDDEGAAHLSKLDSLTGVSLSGSKITSLTVKRFTRLKNLQGLGLSGTRIDDEGLRYIGTLPNITSLELDDTKVTDAGIEHLRSFDLIALTLGNTAVTDRTAQIIAGMKRITRVHLQGTQITNEAVRLLAPLPKLGHELFLQNTAIDDGCVPYIEKMTTKPTIDLRGTNISNAGMQRIRAALRPDAIVYNDHDVPVVDHARLKAERKK